MSHLVTDVTPILMRAFPGGKPEMYATDFDKAKKFVEDMRRNRTQVRYSIPHHMDYVFWAQVMIVDWRMTVADWEKGGKVGPEPAFLLCPTCNVMCILDTIQGDVLLCPGGCHRAITLNSFVSLFKAPKLVFSTKVTSNNTNVISPYTSAPSVVVGRQAGTGPFRLDQTVPKGSRPEDYGITEGVQKSRKPLVGWRMWTLKNTDGKPRLWALSHSIIWEPMQPMRGTCHGKDPSEIKDHTCPSWEHRCGVHAVKLPSQIKRWGGWSTNRVVGEVEMWGRVLEYTDGFRAEWAYPTRLYLNPGYRNSIDFTPNDIWSAYLTEVIEDDGTLLKEFDKK